MTQAASVEAVLELRLRNARVSILRAAPDSPVPVHLKDVTALNTIYSSAQPLGVVRLSDRDLFFTTEKNQVAIEATEGEQRTLVITGRDDDVRESATLREDDGAQVEFTGLAIPHRYTIGVIAPFSADSLFDKAEEIFRAGGSKEEALSLIDRAVGLNPKLAAAWRRKAYIHRELGQAELAMIAAERSISVDPNYARGWRCKGALLRDKQEHQQGLECYLRSLELDPTDATCWTNKGNALAALGKDQEAKEAYAEAGRVNARYPDQCD